MISPCTKRPKGQAASAPAQRVPPETYGKDDVGADLSSHVSNGDALMHFEPFWDMSRVLFVDTKVLPWREGDAGRA